MSDKELKCEALKIAEAAGYLWHRGWAESNGGNISLLLPEGFLIEDKKWQATGTIPLRQSAESLDGRYLMITASGSKMRETAQDYAHNIVVLRVSEKGKAVDVFQRVKEEGKILKPTSELAAHLAIHLARSEAGKKEVAILHTHATELISITHVPDLKSTESLTNLIWSMHPEARIFLPDGVGFVPWELPGSVEMANAVAKSLKNQRVVVAEKHGVFAVGEDVIQAFDLIDIANKSLKIFLTCRSAGLPAEGLTEGQLKDVGKIKF